MRFANAVLAVAVVVVPLAGCNAILGLGSFTNCKGGDVDTPANCASGGGGAGPGVSSSSSSGATGGATSSSSSGNGGSGGNGGGGGPTNCVANMSVACYTGMSGTEDQGVCHGGMKTCDAQGMAYGDCIGEVTPMTEDCSVAGNEACTGPYGCSDIKWATFGQGGSGSPPGTPIAVDKDGNVVALGSYAQTTTWGTFTLNGSGYYLVKATPAGDVTWANSYCGLPLALDVDQQGNIFISGLLTGSCTFGGQTLTAPSYPALLAARVNPDGTLGWAKAFGGATFLSQLAVDSNGDAVVVGVINGSITFGSTTLTATGGSGALYLAKLSGGNGAPAWATRLQTSGTNSSASSYSIALDSANNILVGGSFSGTLPFGGTAGSLVSQGTQDGYLAKLNPSGVGVWASRFANNPSSTMYVASIAVDSGDNVLIGGGFSGGIRVGSFNLNSTVSNALVAKLSSGGTATWAKGFGDATTSVISLHVTATANDAVAVGGYFDSTIQFGGPSTLLTTNGGQDAVIAELDSGGVHRWSKRFGDAGQQSIGGVAYGKMSKSIAIVGSMGAGSIDLGTGTTTAPNGAAFIAEFQP